MALSVQKCIEKLKKLQPDLYPVSYIEDKGKYLFNLLKRGVNRDDATANFYVVDPESGLVAGPVPVMTIMDNDDLSDKLNHPHMIDSEDQKPLIHNLPMAGSYWGVTRSKDFLSHHGIKGQKWGEQNGPPYPLNPEDHSKAEKQAMKKPEKKPGKHAVKVRTNIAKRADQILDAAEREDASKILDREKTKKGDTSPTVVKDVALTVLNPFNVCMLVADGGLAAHANHKMNSYLKKREKNSEKDPKTGLYLKKDGQYDEKQDLAAVNPRFNDMNTNTKNNCMLCSTTYDMRKRGYDVTSQLDSQGYTFSDLKRWYPKAKIERMSRYNENGTGISQKEYMDRTVTNLKKQGDGARGNIMVWWNMGGGHSIVYEVKNGNVIFKDTQANKVYNNPEKLLKQTLTNAYARLDNVKPDMELIKKECVR